jgi:hypothetical protein
MAETFTAKTLRSPNDPVTGCGGAVFVVSRTAC